MNRRQLLTSSLLLLVPLVRWPVTLRWEPTLHATSYRVFRNGQLYGETASPALAIPNEPAQWAVQAVNQHGPGPLSEVLRWQ